MSIFGALQSGISGLSAQSSAMGAISDNIVNVNTVGYKGTSVAFRTLVTKQSSNTLYSPGGVQSSPMQGVSKQGLLSAVSSSTSMAVSGAGYFVVNSAANPGGNDMWAYTRAGDFGLDESGYLKNTGGFYAQGWSLLPYDGNPNASVVNVGGIDYMKAYYDASGKTVYINDNIVDQRNLRPINLASIGGTATPSKQISFGANLPSSDQIFNPSNPEAGGRHSVSALIYDSLGNASNIAMSYTKTSSNGWNMSTSIPAGAATITLSGSKETSGDLTKDVYYAAGQLEFKDVPANGSTISMTDDVTGRTFTFEFVNAGGTAAAGNIAVDVQTGIVSISDFTKKFNEVIQANMPSAGRFSADGNKIAIVQSVAGGALTIDASKTLACVQAAANPTPATGIPTGIFKIQQIDEDIKNSAKLEFVNNPAAGESIALDGVTYSFVAAASVPPVATEVVVGANVNETLANLGNALKSNAKEPARFVVSGTTLEIYPTASGGDIAIDTTGLGAKVTGRLRDGATEGWMDIPAGGFAGVLGNEFHTNTNDVEQGSLVPSVRFGADGTPKYFYTDNMAIEWANGAQNMNDDPSAGNSIKIQSGNPGTNDGLTHLSGKFNTNYVKQDGAKFGSYAGVSVDSSGVVTALFDNGETRPIAILPLATFSNPNGMESLNGNSWIETDYSGAAILNRAGTNGSGAIASEAIELSTVDLATEFSNMIITQRAYSAATKIITTADEMLDELTRLT